MNHNLTPGLHIHADGRNGYGWHQRRDETLEVGEVAVNDFGSIIFRPLVRVKMPHLKDDEHAWHMVKRYLTEVWPKVPRGIKGCEHLSGTVDIGPLENVFNCKCGKALPVKKAQAIEEAKHSVTCPNYRGEPCDCQGIVERAD